ncbi:MAG TPA: tetratricopeptide repeat protein [Pirellulaceae bacterium]|nr:tetratricopeptide repeat protein [Pirellulaceae bacterium]
MSKKNRKGKARESNSQLLERAERELAKGNAKAALKDAKVAFRSEPTPSARKILESAWVERVEQLGRQKLNSEARAALRELIEFKPTDQFVCQQLPRLQVLVGDPNADVAALFERQPELLIQLTDRAVLDWECLPPEHAGIPVQVAAVREALAAVEANDDNRSTALVKDIPRTSPLGEWKLFLRGLTAFYQSDGERTTANWQRLDPTRPPYRIARTLQAAVGDISPTDAVDVATSVKRLEKLLGGGDAYEQLVSLGESWRSGEWSKFFADCRRYCQRHGKTHDATLRRIGDLAWRRAVREGNGNLFRRLTALLPAPEIDPNWHRVRALFAECSSSGNANAVESAWKAYAQDMHKLPCLRDDERTIAEGLIYLRLGRKFIEFGKYNARRMPCPWDDDDQDETADLYKSAVQFLCHSIKVCPQLMDAYRKLAELHEELEDVDKAAAVHQKLLKRVPDDFDAQLWLARYYIERDEPAKAEPYTAAARRLKPRDPYCVALDWTQQIATVRLLTKNRKLDEARAKLQNLHKVRPPEVDLFVLDLIAAAIEFKGKNREAADQFVDMAVSRLEEPTAAWLQMSAIAARYSLPQDVRKEFDQYYKDAIKMRPTSQTAGRLASYFAGIRSRQINYTGRATQERLAIGYVTRATAGRWEESDLALVCEWLSTLSRQGALLGELLSLGLERFPNSPRLSFAAGANEMQHRTFFYNVEFAACCFRTAIENNGRAALPLLPGQLEFARQSLSQLEDILGQERRIKLGSEFDDDDYDEQDDDDDYDEDDDYFDDDDLSGLLPPGVGVDELIKVAPPIVLEALKKLAALKGMTVEDVVRLAIQSNSQSKETRETTPQSRRRGHTPQSNQSHFAFDDE